MPDGPPVYVSALQLEDTVKSALEFRDFVKSDLALGLNTEVLSLVFDGVTYTPGDWVVHCLCGKCEQRFDHWPDDQFSDAFVAMGESSQDSDEPRHDPSVDDLVSDLLDVIEDHRDRTSISLAAAIGSLEFVKLDLFKRETT